MAGITSSGIGSGIDIQSLVSQLVAAERAPVQNRLDRQEVKVQTQLSAYGALKSALSGFREQVKALADAKSFSQMKATSSKPDAIGVSASAGAAVGSYQLEVSALAQAQGIATQAFANTDEVVGGGTLTFRFGTVAVDEASGKVSSFDENPERTAKRVVIEPGSTLAQVRDAVNAANVGVQASIINDGSGRRLVFTAKDTGAANGFVVEVADEDGDDGDAAGLSRLAFNTTASNAEQTRAAEDARLTINGLSIRRASNEITDAIEGVTLSLSDTTTGSVRIDVSRDTAAVQGKIKSFVEAYNKLQQQITALTKYDAENKKASALTGDALVRNLNSKLRSLLTDPLRVLEGGAVRSLADLGIVSKRDGTLEIDNAKLDKALSAHFEEIGALFASYGLTEEATGVEYVGSSSGTQSGRYAVHITQLATQGRYVGTALAVDPAVSPIDIDANNDSFTVKVDGIESKQIRLTHGSYSSGEELARELQARINEDSELQKLGVTVRVSYDTVNNRFEIVSDSYGSESTVEILSADSGLSATLGLAVGEGEAGVDVAGSIGGRIAVGVGQELIGDGGPADGLRLRITGDELGDRGIVVFSRGILAELDGFLGSYLDAEGVLTETTDALNGRLKDIEEDREALDRRMESVQARLLAQFTAMDSLVARLGQTSSYLSQQLASLQTMIG